MSAFADFSRIQHIGNRDPCLIGTIGFRVFQENASETDFITVNRVRQSADFLFTGKIRRSCINW